MASKKKRDLEIVYNLQWKTKTNGDDKQANIVGVYDVPQTTLNWETFKSYLLKNSGTTEDDVKVSYISEEGEVPINSQKDFQIALYTFRKKARNGEVITLWLDRISERKNKKLHLMVIDAQTQVNGYENKAAETTAMTENGPPEWFKKYMKQFRKEFLDDVKELIAPLLAHEEAGYCKPYPTVPITRHEWKSKHESKRNRQSSRAPERDLLKSIRLQNKLENKLEKIERKTLKLKEKSLAAAAAAARSSDSDAGRSNNNHGIGIKLEELEMHFLDAKPVKNPVTIVQHMVGGEVYVQEWEVINSGDISWDSNTDFRFAWGNENLVPISRIVPVPKLKPGEQGTISVALDVPRTPGQYESYWHFYHKDRRFGCWLGCQIIVDPFPLCNSTFNTTELLRTSSSPLPNPFEDHFAPETKATASVVIKSESPKPLNTDEVTEDMKNMNLDECDENKAQAADDTNCSSDSDNQSIISIADTNTSICSGSSDEFVVVPTVENNEVEEKKEVKAEETNEEVKAGGSDDNNNSANDENDTAKKLIDVKKEGNKSGYAYVTLDGKKFAVPKCFLHDEYLATAEDAPDPTESKSLGAIPKTTSEPIPIPQKTTTKIANPLFSKSMTETLPTFSEDFGKLTQSCTTADKLNDSHCSTIGSNFSDTVTRSVDNGRVFVFPAAVPGFEVVSLANDTMKNSAVFTKDSGNENQGVAETKTTSESSLNPTKPWYATPYSYFTSPPPPPVSSSMSYYLDPYRVPTSSYYDSTNPYGQFDPFNEHACLYSHFPTTEIQPMTASAPIYTGHLPAPIQPPSANTQTSQPPPAPHILSENLMTGAVNVASSAINTAKSVLQMITPAKTEEAGRWINGHWITTKPESPREASLRILAEMGFANRDYNASLLNRFDDDIEKVVAELLTTV